MKNLDFGLEVIVCFLCFLSGYSFAIHGVIDDCKRHDSFRRLQNEYQCTAKHDAKFKDDPDQKRQVPSMDQNIAVLRV